MSLTQTSFAAFVQRFACPPPPASKEANGSVLSLAAPAEPGVGVDTSSVPLLAIARTGRVLLQFRLFDAGADEISIGEVPKKGLAGRRQSQPLLPAGRREKVVRSSREVS